MALHDSRILAICLFAATAHAEAAAPKGDDEAVILPPGDCQHYGNDKSWTLTREARLAEILKALSDLTCERFFVSRKLLDDKLTVDVGKEPMSSYELHARVEGALRAKGIVLDVAPASRVRRSSDPRGGGLPPVPYGVSSSIPAEKLDKSIKCDGNKCTLTREIVDALLANTAELASGARFVPSIKEGRPNGFKLYAIRPNSVYGRLGFQNGDTVQSLNGLDITSPDKALEAYAKLRAASHLTVDGERRGQKFTLEWVVK
jgi:hypothetical protein